VAGGRKDLRSSFAGDEDEDEQEDEEEE